MQEYVWRNFRIGIPDDWEMLLYSKDPKSGHCTFADRYQHRLQMNWMLVTNKPDLARMVDDYTSRLSKDDAAAELSRLKIGGWLGFGSRTAEGRRSRLGKFFARESCLVELVFLWPEARDAGLERKILDSVSEEPVRRDGLARWRAFGMDILASKDLDLTGCTVQPAKASMVFRVENNPRREERFQRIGMLDEWMKVSVEQWLRASVPSQVIRKEESTLSEAGHEICSVLGERRLPGPPNPFRRKPKYRADAWVCPNDGRLYHCEITAPMSKVGESDLRRLTCCGDLEHR